MSDSQVTLVGNLSRDPSLHFTPSGQAKAEFGLAVNRSWTDRNTNEKKEQVSFFNVQCWGQLAENAASSLAKGSRAIVNGRLEQQSWEKDGEPKERIVVIADEVGPSLRWATTFIERNERTNQTSNRSSSKSSAPAFDDLEPF